MTISWNEVTIFWNEVNVRWNEMNWNELTMERSDRIPINQRELPTSASTTSAWCGERERLTRVKTKCHQDRGKKRQSCKHIYTSIISWSELTSVWGEVTFVWGEVTSIVERSIT